MTMTVNQILEATSIGNGYHRLPHMLGLVQLPEADMRRALEAAYDAGNPDWLKRVRFSFMQSAYEDSQRAGLLDAVVDL